MLQIYNTLSQQKEPFNPITRGKISLYVCGITVYDFCHIGHARVFVAFDVITRFLRQTGWDVHYVRNITDIDDKIIKRANENNEPFTQLTSRFIDCMLEDEAKLNVIRPNEEPRATDFMAQMTQMIEKIEANGLAYQADNGDVYFSVEKFQSYGALSHKKIEELLVGARVDIAEAKHSPLDFVLWKQSKAHEPKWPSKWGDGRPGWHIECSSMATNCLGNHFDIHGGGADLTFPHHENERAQSQAATNETFVNYWMHVGFVQVDKEKMSKSLKNFFTIREVLEQYDAEVIRYFLISSHYRSPVNYSQDNLEQCKQALTRLYTALKDVDVGGSASENNGSSQWRERFYATMNDDFNTPQALAVLFELATEINKLKQDQPAKATELARELRSLGDILGILTQDPSVFFKGAVDDTQVIDDLIAKRNAARAAKDWAQADIIRQQLTDMGIMIEDAQSGTTWRKL